MYVLYKYSSYDLFFLHACHTSAQPEGGMSDCYKDALLCLKSTLKENVDLKTGLEDKLPVAAGGFMSRTEAQYVAQLPGNFDQMGAVVDTLCKKRDEDFFTFLKMLKDTNNKHWADALRAKAEELKRETVRGTHYTIHITIGMQTARILCVLLGLRSRVAMCVCVCVCMCVCVCVCVYLGLGPMQLSSSSS